MNMKFFWDGSKKITADLEKGERSEMQPDDPKLIYVTVFGEEYSGAPDRVAFTTTGWAGQRIMEKKCRVSTPEEIRAYLAEREAHRKYLENEQLKLEKRQTVTIKPSGPKRERSAK